MNDNKNLFVLVLLFLFHQQLSSQSVHFYEDEYEYSGFSKIKCLYINIYIPDRIKSKIPEDTIKRSAQSLCYNILPDDMIYKNSIGSSECMDYYQEQLNTNKITYDEWEKIFLKSWTLDVYINAGLQRDGTSYFGNITAKILMGGETEYVQLRQNKKKRNEQIERIMANESNEREREWWEESMSKWSNTNLKDVVLFQSRSIFSGYEASEIPTVVREHVTNILEELNVAIRKWP